MAIIDRHVSPGLTGAALEVLEPTLLGSYKASAIAGIFTKQTFASTVNSTFAVGTQPDFPRALAYQMSLTNGTGSSQMISGGTVVVSGFNQAGVATYESKAFTDLAAASVPVIGAVIFGSLASNGVSIQNFSLATASSSASNSVSFSVGVANVIGLPVAINAAGTRTIANGGVSAVPMAYIGTLNQAGSYSVSSGPLGIARMSMSNALATNTPVMAYIDWNA